MSGFQSFCDHPRFFKQQLLPIAEIWAASGIWKHSSPDLSLTSVPDNWGYQVPIRWKNFGQAGNNKIPQLSGIFSTYKNQLLWATSKILMQYIKFCTAKNIVYLILGFHFSEQE